MTLSYAPPTQDQLLDALTTLERHLLQRVRAEQVETPSDSPAEEAEEMAARPGRAPAAAPSGSRLQPISERV
jgi:hypothetical protein